MPINKDTLYFFRLIRSGAGLGAAPVSDTADTAVTPGSWERIYRMAADHGLSAVVWDGICRLPAAQQPPRETRIRWALSAEKLEERYRHQQQTASKLAARFSEEGLRMLLLKGLGLSRDYPIPEHRECGLHCPSNGLHFNPCMVCARCRNTLFHYPKFDQTNDSCLLNSLDHQRLGLADPAFGLLAKKIKQNAGAKIRINQ